jgi:hypothetical protein
MANENEKLYMEREKRIYDAVALKQPDRVPLTASFYFFPAVYYGATKQELMYNPDKLWDLQLRCTLEFAPDLAQNPFGLMFYGPLYEALDFKQTQWPGGQLAADVPFQFVEGEYMKADEYDMLFSNPAEFALCRYWPRISGALKTLEKLPPFNKLTTYAGHGFIAIMGRPEFQEMLDALKKAGAESARLGDYSRRFDAKLKEEGFPTQGGGLCQAPFDFLGDYLRGTKGLMLDMYRRPDTVIKACETILPLEIERGVATAKATGSKIVFIALHKGLDGFMSLAQFDKFYWPTLKELVCALIKEDLIPYLFWEGNCTSRLDHISDIPAGKAIYRFEATDMFKAKDALRDKVCIRGNVPISILATGTPDEVKDYCRKLIDYAGKDGGYIMDSSAGLTEARPENLRAMFDFTREYGVY